MSINHACVFGFSHRIASHLLGHTDVDVFAVFCFCLVEGIFPTASMRPVFISVTSLAERDTMTAMESEGSKQRSEP